MTSTIAFDTSAEWFVASIPSITLSEKDRHYDSPTASFIQRSWISPVMYIKFPAAVTIAHSWVYDARTVGDDFGWNKMGLVSCQPRPGTISTIGLRTRIVPVTIDPKDEDHLEAPPSKGSAIIAVTKSPPLKQANCANPFSDASVTRQVSPEYPALVRKPAIDVTSTT